jgi:hypothetical protein
VATGRTADGQTDGRSRRRARRERQRNSAPVPVSHTSTHARHVHRQKHTWARVRGTIPSSPSSSSSSARPLVCYTSQPCASPSTSRAQSTSEPLRPGHSADVGRGAAPPSRPLRIFRSARHGGQWLSARYHVPDLGSASGGGLPRRRRSARTMVDGCLPTTSTSTSTRRWPPHQWSLVRA